MPVLMEVISNKRIIAKEREREREWGSGGGDEQQIRKGEAERKLQSLLHQGS